jgi:hypothetical protein
VLRSTASPSHRGCIPVTPTAVVVTRERDSFAHSHSLGFSPHALQAWQGFSFIVNEKII